jgi:membrane associated rhomboid family serine protease
MLTIPESSMPPADDLSAPTGARRASREPMINAPPVVLALVGALLLIHGLTTLASPETLDAIVGDYAFMPGRLTLLVWPQSLGEILARANHDSDALQQASMIRHFHVLQTGGKPWTLLTYAFLHGGWTHVGLNSVWIIAFGPPVARRIGALRFLALFATTAIAGALMHWAFNMMDFTPLIGASAADSGLMAAAVRFAFEPGGPLGAPGGVSRLASDEASVYVAAPPLFRLLRERRVVVFLGIWFVANFIFGAGAEQFGLSDGPVAWLAHVGGFLVGLLAFPLFDRARPSSAGV